MKFAITSCLCLLFLLQVGTAKDEEKQKTIKQVVAELKKEAQASFKNGFIKRSVSSYANESKLKFPVKEVISQLSKRHDRNPGVDAYIKFQLAGFVNYTKLKSEAKSKDIMKMIGAMPPYMKIPPPPAPVQSAVSSLVGVDTKKAGDKAKIATKAFYKYQNMPQVKQAKLSNQVIALYGDQLAQTLPRDTALRYYFKLKNINDRLAVGDETALGTGKKKMKSTSLFIGFSRVKDSNPKMIAAIKSEIDRMGSQKVKVFKGPTTKKRTSKDKKKEWREYQGGFTEIKPPKTEDIRKAFNDQLKNLKLRATRN